MLDWVWNHLLDKISSTEQRVSGLKSSDFWRRTNRSFEIFVLSLLRSELINAKTKFLSLLFLSSYAFGENGYSLKTKWKRITPRLKLSHLKGSKIEPFLAINYSGAIYFGVPLVSSKFCLPPTLWISLAMPKSASLNWTGKQADSGSDSFVLQCEMSIFDSFRSQWIMPLSFIYFTVLVIYLITTNADTSNHGMVKT